MAIWVIREREKGTWPVMMMIMMQRARRFRPEYAIRAELTEPTGVGPVAMQQHDLRFTRWTLDMLNLCRNYVEKKPLLHSSFPLYLREICINRTPMNCCTNQAHRPRAAQKIQNEVQYTFDSIKHPRTDWEHMVSSKTTRKKEREKKVDTCSSMCTV